MLYSKKLSFTHFYLFFFLFLFSYKNAKCQIDDYSSSISICNYALKYNSLNDGVCFSNALFFKHKSYQVNHFAKNKNGDLVGEFTESNEFNVLSSSRLLYGLKKNGRNLFSNESSYTLEFNIDIDEQTYNENEYFYFSSSKNLFVSNRGNQYLFSINSYNSMVELYDLNNNNNKFQVWNFNKFFNLDENMNLLYDNYDIFELKRESTYIIAFISNEFIATEMKNAKFIKKFRFKPLDVQVYDEINSMNFEEFENRLILNVFLMDDGKEYTFVVLTSKMGRRRMNSKIIPPGDWLSLRSTSSSYEFNLMLYKSNLNKFKEMEIYNNYLSNYCNGKDTEKIHLLNLNI